MMLMVQRLKRLGALALMIVASSCANTSYMPEHSLYLLEGSSNTNPDVYADCLGILNSALSHDQLAKLLSNGGTISSQGEDSKFEIDGKLQPGKHICYTKLLVVRASPKGVQIILDKNKASHANEVNIRQRQYNAKAEEEAKREEYEKNRINALLESAN